MLNLFGKVGAIAAAVAATLMAASPAEARRYRDGGDDAAIAIGAGVVGLALGAAIASDRNDRYYDRRYYRGYYYDDYRPRYRNYYYRDYPRYRHRDRYYRDRNWHRNDRRYYRGDRHWRGDRHRYRYRY